MLERGTGKSFGGPVRPGGCGIAPSSTAASWGADGTIVLAPSANSSLFRVNAAGGEPQPLTTLDEQAREVTHRWPQILPGSQAVLFTSHTSSSNFDDAVIEVVKLDTGERTVVHRRGAYGRYLPSGHLVFLQHSTLFAMPTTMFPPTVLSS